MLTLITVLVLVGIAAAMRHAYVLDRRAKEQPAPLRQDQGSLERDARPDVGPLTNQDLEWLDQQARRVWLTEFEWVHRLRMERRRSKHYPISNITREAWLKEARKKRGKNDQGS